MGVWRRAAALSAGGALGAMSVSGQRELRLTQPAEAFCPCSLTCAAVTASSAVLGAFWLVNFGERLAQQHGREVLLQMAEAGDPGAQLAVASMVAMSSGNREHAVRYYGHCKETVADCAAAYVAFGGGDSPDEVNELLRRAGMLAEADYRVQADTARDQGLLPAVHLSPVMPGMTLTVDEDDRYAASYVARPYLKQALQHTSMSLLAQDPAEISTEARRGALQLLGLRGMQPAFFILGNEQLKEGNDLGAAEYFLRACIAPWMDSGDQNSQFGNVMNQMYLVGRLASVARLCELINKGVEVPYADVQVDQLRALLGEIDASEPTPAVERCVRLGKMENPQKEDYSMCAEGLTEHMEQAWNALTEHLVAENKREHNVDL